MSRFSISKWILEHYISQTHTHYRHALVHTRGDAERNLLSVQRLPREFINKIVSQLKSYMTFLSSEVLEAVQLKDLLLDAAAEHC